jgi:hypothetical protein
VPQLRGAHAQRWLRDIHARLDEAVLAAYGWPASSADEELLERLLALNHERAGVTTADT